MTNYISLLQFTDKGIRNIQDSPKRAAASKALARKMGVKLTGIYWTLGPYDIVLVAEAPNDETMTAFSLSLASLGNVKTQTMRAFRSSEFEGILKKMR